MRSNYFSEGRDLWRLVRHMGIRRMWRVLRAPSIPKLRERADELEFIIDAKEDRTIELDGAVALTQHETLVIELRLARLKAEREAADWWRRTL